MEMQSIQPHPLAHQPTLESQRSDNERSDPNIQASLRSLYRVISAYIRRETYTIREASEVDAALAAAAQHYKDGRRFLNEYANVSRNKLPLHRIFDLFVRVPHGTNPSSFIKRSLRRVVFAKRPPSN